MPKLNQIIAILTGKKSQAKESLTQAYHQLQKGDLLSGISRTYKPKDENGETLPPEGKLVQVKVGDVIQRIRRDLTEMFDIVATQDWANCQAKADVVVDGRKILSGVPVTHLLFLEKQLVDLNTFIEKLPTLDAAERWEFNSAQDCYASEPFQTTRTKKIPRSHIKYEATTEHPAQVEMYYEDVTVGIWTTLKYSGAIPASQRNLLLERVRKLADAVKAAREEANSVEVEKKSCGDAILGFLFSDV
ncbi:MAG: hypothetical protein IT428_16090 [Planctomycetaceae bacterium]|nr:hypothetical protein [Planctomycetaceae bacterium]